MAYVKRYAEGSQYLIKVESEKSLQEINKDEEYQNTYYRLNYRAYNEP